MVAAENVRSASAYSRKVLQPTEPEPSAGALVTVTDLAMSRTGPGYQSLRTRGSRSTVVDHLWTTRLSRDAFHYVPVNDPHDAGSCLTCIDDNRNVLGVKCVGTPPANGPTTDLESVPARMRPGAWADQLVVSIVVSFALVQSQPPTTVAVDKSRSRTLSAIDGWTLPDLESV